MSSQAQALVLPLASHRLEGKTLPSGWTVVRKDLRTGRQTGGCQSVGYWLKKPNGDEAFLKALDYTKAIGSADALREMELQLAGFNFERSLLDNCKDRRLSRVVMAVEKGEVIIDPHLPFVGTVPYIIFESGDDLRRVFGTGASFSAATRLRTLHHIITGLRQLHEAGIVHQDLKPSNIIRCGSFTKLADLGRATTRQRPSPFDDLRIPGDPTHAPPESLYGYEPPDWNERRFGYDLYLLGSMMSYVLIGASMTAMVQAKLNDAYRYKMWSGSFADALPFLKAAFGGALAEISQWLPPSMSDLVTGIRGLCEPDPAARGFVLGARAGLTRFDLQRIQSRVNHLARLAELGMGEELP